MRTSTVYTSRNIFYNLNVIIFLFNVRWYDLLPQMYYDKQFTLNFNL